MSSEPAARVDTDDEGVTSPMYEIFERMLGHVAREEFHMPEGQSSVPVENYISEARWQQERDVLFRRFPLIVAHDSELPEVGSTLRHDGIGVPMVITRGQDAEVRAFLNVCRHRGMRLQEERQCSRKTLVCPYHGWTYNLDGSLRHVPHEEFFPDSNPAELGLTELPCEGRNGLGWVLPTPAETIDVADWLGSMTNDFSCLGMDNYVQYRSVEETYPCNWKLIIDAFLEAYHVKVLHRNSVYPFFLDAMAISEPVNRHMRSIVARRKMLDVVDKPAEHWDFREHCSFTHFVFPNTIFVHHPAYTSVLTFYPTAVDEMRWVHHMLITEERQDEKEHWENTFQLINKMVFEAEDIDAAVQIQAGLNSGANSEILLGKMEYTIRQFHDGLQSAIDEMN